MDILNRELARQADRYIDDSHEDFAELGQRFFEAFGYDHKANRLSTQVRNLQQITLSARRFVDIEDFVKNQMGKRTNKWPAVGEEVLSQLKALRRESRDMSEDRAQEFLLRLHLARGWVNVVVGEYLYQVAQSQMEGSS